MARRSLRRLLQTQGHGGRSAVLSMAALLLLASGWGLSRSAWAQTPSQPNPEAVTGSTYSGTPCPMIVPLRQWENQPLRIQPNQVAQKNRMGCLSPVDAHYGPDGCPRVMCGAKRGVLPLQF